jgi:hypothetical protein
MSKKEIIWVLHVKKTRRKQPLVIHWVADSCVTLNRSDADLMHDKNILHITITSTNVCRKTTLERMKEMYLCYIQKKNSFKDYWRLRSVALSHPGAHIYTRSADVICFAIVCTFPSQQVNDLIPPYRSVIVIRRRGCDTIVIYLDIL